MFSNRRPTAKRSNQSKHTMSKRAAIIGLAAASATPLNLGVSVALADRPVGRPAQPASAVVPALLAEQPKLSDAELLKQGVDQYAKAQYEEALDSWHKLMKEITRRGPS